MKDTEVTKERKLGEPTRLRIYAEDQPLIDQLAERTELDDVAIKRKAIHLGLRILAKKHRVPVPTREAA